MKNLKTVNFYSIPFLIILFLGSCNQQSRNRKEETSPEKRVNKTADTSFNELVITTKFHEFDTTLEVLFTDTFDSISNCQRKNYEGFISKQDSLMPDILTEIFKFYKDSYPSYKEGWTIVPGLSNTELEKNLPTPSTPEKLKAFIIPIGIDIQNKADCEEGSIGIEFYCPWDIKNGLGILIRNWKVERAGLAEVAYFLN